MPCTVPNEGCVSECMFVISENVCVCVCVMCASLGINTQWHCQTSTSKVYPYWMY